MGDEKTLGPERGFTLIETMIAMAILMVGILGLAAMLGDSMAYMQSSQNNFIAQQKAEEAIEAIFTAKYTNTITFAEIANTTSNPPGIFLSGPQPILQPGDDGLVGTLEDVSAPPAHIIYPGPDGLLGTSDDVDVPLSDFTRTISIAPTGDSNLSSVTVTINYRAGRFQRSYTMNTLVSAFN